MPGSGSRRDPSAYIRCCVGSSPAPLAVTTEAATPIRRIVVSAPQQFTGDGRLDHGDGAVGPCLRTCGIERMQHMQPLAGVCVDGGEDRRMLGDVQIRL